MSERLDRVEAILEQLAERQNRFQQQLEATNQQTRSVIRETAEDVVNMIGSLAESQTQTQAQLDATQAQLDALSAHVAAYIAQSSAFLAAERLDRAEFRQQMVGLQTETRNILRELADMRRQGN